MLKQRHREACLVRIGIGREKIGAGVQAPLADNRAAGLHLRAIHAQMDRGKAVTRQFAQGLQGIGGAADGALQRNGQVFHHMRIEPHPQHLHEQPG